MSDNPRGKIPHQVIRLLLKNKKMRFMELKEKIGVSKPSLSEHLAILLKEGSITVVKEGREKHYSLIEKPVQTLERKIERLSFDFTSLGLLELTVPNKPFESLDEVYEVIGKKLNAFFIFTLLKSIETGDNWFKAFDIEIMAMETLDLLTSLIIEKDMPPEEFQDVVYGGKMDKFFKEFKKTQNTKDKKNIRNMFNHLKEKYPEEFKILAKEGK